MQPPSEVSASVFRFIHEQRRLQNGSMEYHGAQLESFGIDALEPASYLEILHFLKQVRQVWTDSGGLQKEAYFMGRQQRCCEPPVDGIAGPRSSRLRAQPAELIRLSRHWKKHTLGWISPFLCMVMDRRKAYCSNVAHG